MRVRFHPRCSRKLTAALPLSLAAVRVSYLDIYNEGIRDLLAKDRKALQLKQSPEQGVYAQDLSMFALKSVAEFEHVLNAGLKNRMVDTTKMGRTSAHAHSIFTIVVESSATDARGEKRVRVGKLHLVELAGSEHPRTTATMNREASTMGRSMSALRTVVSALADRRQRPLPRLADIGRGKFIPYRDSKLTRLLQDSLGGSAKTLMIATIGPADYNYEETLSTLRFATLAKLVHNTPRVNMDPKDSSLRCAPTLCAPAPKYLSIGTGTYTTSSSGFELSKWCWRGSALALPRPFTIGSGRQAARSRKPLCAADHARRGACNRRLVRWTLTW